MPLFFWLDIVALSLSIVMATALVMTLLGAGPDRALNRLFALFALTEACWALLSLLLRLELWLGKGDPLFVSELAVLCFAAMGPMLLQFAARYVGLQPFWIRSAGGAGLVVIAALSLLVFSHQVVVNPQLEPNGSTTLDVSTLGIILSVIPGLYILWSLVLFWKERRRLAGIYLVLSVVALIMGFLVGGLFQVDFPVLSLTNTLSLMLLGHVVMGEQVFNPLRERTAELQREIVERKRADEMPQRRAAQLAILNDVGKQIAALSRLDSVLKRATQLILDNFDYHHVAIFTVDHEQGRAMMKTRAGAFIELFPQDHSLKLGQGMVGWVAQTGERLLANDVRIEPHYVNFYPDVFPTRAELDVPIRIGQEIAGVLNIQSPQTDDFDEDDIMVIETLAGQIAAAIENARLYESIQQELTERERAEDALRKYTVRLGTLRDLDQAILAAETPKAIAEAALDHLRDLIPCRRASIAMFDFRSGKVDVLTGQADAGAGASLEVSGLDPCLLKGEIAVIDDLPGPPCLSDQNNSTQDECVRSCISVPIMFHGTLVGSLNMGSAEPSFFKQEQIDIASEVANQLGIAIQQAYLHEQIQKHASELEQHVAERTAQLTAAYQELQALSHVKDAFVANVSHELRTPISSLKLYVQLLNLCPEKQSAYLESLEREADRLSDLIEGLLMLSHLDQNRIQLVLSPCDLNALVREYVTDRTLLAETRKLILSLETMSDLPLIKGDRSLLGQVLSAMLTNAINYTPEGGLVMVSTLKATDGRECGFCVADTGPGIQADERIFLFDRFYRGRAAYNSRIPGTGLGLAVAREIVDLHRGRIEVQSEGIVGKGVRFFVWLPADPASNMQ